MTWDPPHESGKHARAPDLMGQESSCAHERAYPRKALCSSLLLACLSLPLAPSLPRHPLPQRLDVPQRRRSEQALLLTVESRRAFVADFEGRAGGVALRSA